MEYAPKEDKMKTLQPCRGAGANRDQLISVRPDKEGEYELTEFDGDEDDFRVV